jgi:hypothetical protein
MKDILAVFGVQISLWFFFPWWIALLSLPLAIAVVWGIAILAMPLLSKLVHTVYWDYYRAYAPSISFAVGQVIAAYTLNVMFS